MNATVSWYNEDKTILLQTYWEDWGMAEGIYVIDTTYELASSVDHDIFIIVDFTQQKSIHPHLLGNLSHAAQKMPSNLLKMYLVRPGIHLTSLVNVARVVAPRYVEPMQIVTSMDEALEQIEQHRAGSTLPSASQKG